MGHTDSGFYIFRTTDAPGSTGILSPSYDLTVGNDGKVGIGTNAPTNRLHVVGNTLIDFGDLDVNGDVFADAFVAQLRAQLQVPDYVFEPEYPLMPLDELRAYVAKEKHLPNVPSEEEIRTGGLDVTDFQMRLLEKVEELTLYTLAQDEQIESMQQMIADLETRLAALEVQE
jgi:hypothetical protein